MDLCFGLEQDVWHALDSPGAYEWWYFDAIDDGGEYALVAIYCLGLPFSPHYREAVREHRAGSRGVPDPRDFALLSFTLYRRGRWHSYLLNEYPADQCETTADRPFIRIAGSAAEWLPGEGAFRVRVADSLLGGGGIEGELRFRPEALPHCTTGPGDGSASHTWVLAAPVCRVEGAVRIRRPAGEETVRFSGTGYHDHNHGTEDFTAAMRAWSWGRVHLPDATLVYYDVTPLDGLAPTRRLLLVERGTGRVHRLEGPVAGHGWRANPFLLRAPGEIRFHGTSEGVKVEGQVRPGSIVDPGPFYLRFLSDFDVTVEQDGRSYRHRGQGFAEYLQPARLDWRWTWPMLKTRFIRSTG
jgi:carotenoid 1,2-hydratase